MLKTNLTTVVFLASLASIAPAQTHTFETAPTGYSPDAVTGNFYSSIFGGYANGRFQLANGGLRGHDGLLYSVQFRADGGRVFNSNSGMGRKWSNVKLVMAESDHVTMKSTWDNARTVPSVVMDNAMSWDTVTGQPATPKWSEHTSKITFTRPWFYSGDRDLLLDFSFTGGKLANGQDWNWSHRSYCLNSVYIPHGPAYAVAKVEYAPEKGGCNDNLLEHNLGAAVWADGIVYSDGYTTNSLRGKLVLRHFTNHTAPLAPVIQGVALGGIEGGLTLDNVACNRLYLDMPMLAALTLRRTDTFGYSGYASNNGQYIVPFDKAWTGVSLWFQGAWEQSNNRAVSLTRSARVELPAKPADDNRRTVYHADRDHATGHVSDSPLTQPIMLFEIL